MIKRAEILLLAVIFGMAAPAAKGSVPVRAAVVRTAVQEGISGDKGSSGAGENEGNAGAFKTSGSSVSREDFTAVGSFQGKASAASELSDGKDSEAAAGTDDDDSQADRKEPTGSGAVGIPSEPNGTGSTGEDSGDEGDGADVGNMSGVTLKMDNRHLYDGMEKPYRKGYIPVIEDGKAILVLPLLADGELEGGRLTAGLDLGDPSGCPFVYRNYEKDVRLTEQEVDDGQAKVKAYYVRFDLKLASGRSDGIYPVNIRVRARDTQGNPLEQNFVTYVTIKGSPASRSSDDSGMDSGVGSGSGGGEPAEEKPTSQPIMLVEKVRVEGGLDGEAQAGSKFTVKVTLKNTNGKKAVQNMVVTASCETPGLTLLNESNTTYIERIGKGKTTEITLRYRADADTPEGKYDIRLAMSYDNEKAETLTSEGIFSIHVRQPLTVEMTMPEVPAQVHAGDTLPLSFQFMNLGRSMVYNVRCELEGEGLAPSTVAFVGNMEAGTAQTADMNVFIDTLMGEELYGDTTGTVTLRYEDAVGKEYTQTFDFQTKIGKPVIQSAAVDQKEVKTAGQWWISVASAGGLLLIAAAVLLSKRRYHEMV